MKVYRIIPDKTIAERLKIKEDYFCINEDETEVFLGDPAKHDYCGEIHLKYIKAEDAPGSINTGKDCMEATAYYDGKFAGKAYLENINLDLVEIDGELDAQRVISSLKLTEGILVIGDVWESAIYKFDVKTRDIVYMGNKFGDDVISSKLWKAPLYIEVNTDGAQQHLGDIYIYSRSNEDYIERRNDLIKVKDDVECIRIGYGIATFLTDCERKGVDPVKVVSEAYDDFFKENPRIDALKITTMIPDTNPCVDYDKIREWITDAEIRINNNYERLKQEVNEMYEGGMRFTFLSLMGYRQFMVVEFNENRISDVSSYSLQSFNAKELMSILPSYGYVDYETYAHDIDKRCFRSRIYSHIGDRSILLQEEKGENHPDIHAIGAALTASTIEMIGADNMDESIAKASIELYNSFGDATPGEWKNRGMITGKSFSLYIEGEPLTKSKSEDKDLDMER